MLESKDVIQVYHYQRGFGQIASISFYFWTKLVDNNLQDTTSTKDFFKVVDPEAGFAGGFVTVIYRKVN